MKIYTPVDAARKEGLRVGLLRPKMLYPFPQAALLDFASRPGRQIVSVELSNGQMRDDIRLTVGCRCPVHLLNRLGGHVVEQEQVLAKVRELAKG